MGERLPGGGAPASPIPEISRGGEPRTARRQRPSSCLRVTTAPGTPYGSTYCAAVGSTDHGTAPELALAAPVTAVETHPPGAGLHPHRIGGAAPRAPGVGARHLLFVGLNDGQLVRLDGARMECDRVRANAGAVA